MRKTIIGMRVTSIGAVTEVATDNGDLAAFQLSADVANSWHLHAGRVFDTAWPLPDGSAFLFACVADECGPVNPYALSVATAFGLTFGEIHGDAYLITLTQDDTDTADGSMFAEMPVPVRDQVREIVAREYSTMAAERVGAPAGD